MPFIAIIIISLLGNNDLLFYGKKRTMREGIITKYGNRPALYMFYGRRKDFNLMQNDFEKNKEKLNWKMKFLSDAAIVPLLGNERSPEIITEIAGALQKIKKFKQFMLLRFQTKLF